MNLSGYSALFHVLNACFLRNPISGQGVMNKSMYTLVRHASLCIPVLILQVMPHKISNMPDFSYLNTTIPQSNVTRGK